jgi:hypothetical protein
MNKAKNTEMVKEQGKALAENYLRGFASKLNLFGEFDNFLSALEIVVAEDEVFQGELCLAKGKEGSKLPEFSEIEEDETYLSISSQDCDLGYLRINGRRDEESFNPGDLYLLGSIAEFVSALVQQAQNFRKKDQAEKILQYLINQLPLGVVCFASEGQLIVENKTARRLLGDDGSAIIEKELAGGAAFKKGRVQLHFEIGGKLIYSEGRALEVEEGVSIHAYVLYDLSTYREKLLMDLEREAYRSELRGIPVTVALLESRSLAGGVYRRMKHAAQTLQVEPSKIQPLDAYTSACIFEGKRLQSVRYLLKQELASYKGDELSVAIVGYEGGAGGDAPAQELIERARSELRPFQEALLPELIVMDAYPAVIESLDLMISELCRLRAETCPDAIESLIRSGQFDGLFFDLDSYSPNVLSRLKAVAEESGGGFKFYYCTYKKPSMVAESFSLTRKDTVLQKPFDAEATIEAVALQFDLA